MNSIQTICADLRTRHPLIHCITNPISINQCANAVLALGARPIMAEHPKEVREITGTADALLLNLGNITDARMEAMPISLAEASRRKIPVVLDAVGVACSGLRRDFVRELLEIAVPTVIKGNYSEIQALCSEHYRSAGVDADAALTCSAVANAAAALARRLGCVVLASGKTDVVTDGKRLVYVHNGTPALSTVTGTGCLLGVLCACCLSVGTPVEAAASACAMLGVSGELAPTDRGTGSFLVHLMDNLSTLRGPDYAKYKKWEETTIETI